MLHTFDCSCRLRVHLPDPADLEQLAGAVEHLAEGRAEIVRSLVALAGGEERVDLTVAAEDAASARRLARELVQAIAQHLCVRYGPDAVRTEALHIRSSAPPDAAGAAPADGYPTRLCDALQRQHHAVPASIDDFEGAIRAAGTRGPGGRPSTGDVLAKLDEWRVYARGFEVVEVGPHHLTLHFDELPGQLHQFAEDVLLFCPEVTDEVDGLEDLVDAPAATVARIACEGIAENLLSSRLLRLWWD